MRSRTTTARITVILTAVVLATATLTSCSVNIGKTHCNLNVQNPHQSNGSPRYMDAKLTFSCDGLVRDALVKIKLQKQSGSGQWVDVPRSTNTDSRSQLDAGRVVKLMTAGNLLCSVGTYRALGWGRGTNAQGVRDESKEWYPGNVVKVTCPKR
jgi:hypothetical protein